VWIERIMIEAILFDLDDTLLGNNTATFMQGYFSLLREHVQESLDRDLFMQGLLLGTQAMLQDASPGVTNREVFWHTFQQVTGLDPEVLEPFFDDFYLGQFSQLAALTQTRPVAVPLLRSCFEWGLKVVVATNPVFPHTAVEARLAWAGVPVSEFAYDLVTTYHNMHATKPHQGYYREILEKIACSPATTLMVGDDWERDIIPAAALGLYTYWIQSDGQEPADASIASDYGSLIRLYDRLQSGWLRANCGPVTRENA
jgi:HAD superfamily hydrolase (TIGR01549 family)